MTWNLVGTLLEPTGHFPTIFGVLSISPLPPSSISNGCLASGARQPLVGKHGWEVWVCGQAGRFAGLSTYPHRPPAYPQVVLPSKFKFEAGS